MPIIDFPRVLFSLATRLTTAQCAHLEKPARNVSYHLPSSRHTGFPESRNAFDPFNEYI